MTAPTPPSQDRISREALLAAKQAIIRDAAKKRAEAAVAPPPKSRSGSRFFLAAIALGLAGLLVLRPAWLFPPPVVETPAVQDASLRVRMYVEILRIERFRQDQGRLPTTLLESGGDTTGLQYVQDGRTYSITGKNAGRSLTYRSTTPPETFLGNSYELIRQRSLR